jgi:hypothetical protein
MAEADYQLTLPARTETDDDPAIAATLAKVKDQRGMIPNLYARMANVPGLYETHRTGSEAFRHDSGSPRPSRRRCCWRSAAPTAVPIASLSTAPGRKWPTCPRASRPRCAAVSRRRW